MAITVTTMAAETAQRLGDPAFAIWSAAILQSYVQAAILSCYPTYFIRTVATTAPTAGPVQTAPAGAANIYQISLIRDATATRGRMIRGWTEGNGTAYIPKVGINVDASSLLIWAWTAPLGTPATITTDITAKLTLMPGAYEWILTRSMISALEQLLANRILLDRYLAVQVRMETTEVDIIQTIDALHVSLDDFAKNAIPRPGAANPTGH